MHQQFRKGILIFQTSKEKYKQIFSLAYFIGFQDFPMFYLTLIR